MNPKVSIVMPVYNCKKYLQEALESITHQTYRDFEVICVDDGSTDGSVEILDDYANKDERFHVVKQNNQFAGVARNNGMQLATGKYLMFLDSDDVFEKNMLSYLVRKAERNQTDIVYFGFYEFKNKVKNRTMMGIPYHSRKIFAPTDHKEDIFQIAQGLPWNKLYSRQFVLDTGIKFQDLRNDNDQLFVRTIVLEAKRLLFVNKRLVNYRISNETSLSYHIVSENLLKSTVAIYDALIDSGKYNFYQDSFEKYVIERYLNNISKCQDYENFCSMCDAMKKSFELMKMTVETSAIKNDPSRDFWNAILLGDNQKSLFQLCAYMWQEYCPKKSIEYRVGKKILGMTKVRSYD